MSYKKILIDLEMIKLGLAPEHSGYKLRKMLDTLSQEDRRKIKRKFRKVWKKMCKEDPGISRSVGLGIENPTPSHMKNRRAWVRRKISLKISQE